MFGFFKHLGIGRKFAVAFAFTLPMLAVPTAMLVRAEIGRAHV